MVFVGTRPLFGTFSSTYFEKYSVLQLDDKLLTETRTLVKVKTAKQEVRLTNQISIVRVTLSQVR